jgi:hypothetical protein
MYTSSKKRYYTPQFSEMAAVSVRRIAWAQKTNMIAIVDHIVSKLPGIFDPAAVCSACRDRTRCGPCVFNNQPTADSAAVTGN